jgi:hypothetical protein
MCLQLRVVPCELRPMRHSVTLCLPVKHCMCLNHGHGSCGDGCVLRAIASCPCRLACCAGRLPDVWAMLINCLWTLLPSLWPPSTCAPMPPTSLLAARVGAKPCWGTAPQHVQCSAFVAGVQYPNQLSLMKRFSLTANVTGLALSCLPACRSHHAGQHAPDQRRGAGA